MLSSYKTRDMDRNEKRKMLHVQRRVSLPSAVNLKAWLCVFCVFCVYVYTDRILGAQVLH